MTNLPKRPAIRRTAALLALILALLLAAPALAGPATHYAHDGALHPLSALDLASVTGGGCTTCDDDAEEEDEDAEKVGSPYWETYRTELLSRSASPASLIVKVNNYGYTTNVVEQYGYTTKSSVNVSISGGYGSFVTASVGGEYSETRYVETTLTVPPRTSAKVYIKYWTERVMRYGRLLQDYTDGSREIVGTSSGTVERTWTEKSIITNKLD